ncbi:MAG: amino acid ABC transporter ATP-binding protein [Proteobacteria bacterium]|nr:amino acid ABC transporter ATP-binding protein [Pseudomonadota bacterium]
MDVPAAGRAPIIEAACLRKSFGSFLALKGVSFAARHGEVVAIIGASGSGKSTFLRCLNFLERPDAGEICFDGEVIQAGPPTAAQARGVERLRRRSAMVFQQFNLWSHWTVLENVMKVPVHVQGMSPAAAREKALALLNRVGLLDKWKAYPSQLSGGQQQRVAIARALAVEPELLLFDEPTSALDPELVGEVLAVIRGLARDGQTMLIVTHEMGFAREVSDRTVFFQGGQIAEMGASRELLIRPQTQRLATFLGSIR